MRCLIQIGAGLVLVMTMCAAMGQSPASSGPAALGAQALDAQRASGLLRYFRDEFVLPPELAVDDKLRDEAAAIAAAHLSRMEPVFRLWAAELRAASPSSSTDGRVETQLLARLLNEFAWWRLDSAGATYDAVITSAALVPGRCRLVQQLPLFAQQVLLVQQAPAEQRAMLMAAERQLLDRWGAPRAPLPARPVPSLVEREDRDIARMVRGDGVPTIPMPPVVASNTLVRERPWLSRGLACAIHQWALQVWVPDDAAQAASALQAWRYATMPEAASWLNAADRLLGKTVNDYPPFAAQFGVEGLVNVAVDVDAQGRVASTSIQSRELTVSGLGDLRPVAFETVLDKASIARARSPDLAAQFKLHAGQVPARIVVPIRWGLQ